MKFSCFVCHRDCEKLCWYSIILYLRIKQKGDLWWVRAFITSEWIWNSRWHSFLSMRISSHITDASVHLLRLRCWITGLLSSRTSTSSPPVSSQTGPQNPQKNIPLEDFNKVIVFQYLTKYKNYLEIFIIISVNSQDKLFNTLCTYVFNIDRSKYFKTVERKNK